MKKEFVVIGLGRFGGSIVRELVKQGANVMAIDTDSERESHGGDGGDKRRPELGIDT